VQRVTPCGRLAQVQNPPCQAKVEGTLRSLGIDPEAAVALPGRTRSEGRTRRPLWAGARPKRTVGSRPLDLAGRQRMVAAERLQAAARASRANAARARSEAASATMIGAAGPAASSSPPNARGAAAKARFMGKASLAANGP
jgi:hypothetical protein